MYILVMTEQKFGAVCILGKKKNHFDIGKKAK